MKLTVQRFCLDIIPETVQDEVMLEELFGLRKEGDTLTAKRVNAMGLSCWAYLRIEKPEPGSVSIGLTR